MGKANERYNGAIECTQQFKMCGNPFRIDTYMGCTFDCKYCFARLRTANEGWHDQGIRVKKADIREYERMFKKSLEGDKEFKDYNVEMMRHRVPLHLGGQSDPFQAIEFTSNGGVTRQVIELTNKYDYPMMMSTKACSLPDDYWEILDPSRHAFQVSVMGFSDEFIRQYEDNTPTAKERLDFVRELHNRGFWVSIRIQPLIDLEEAKKVVEYIGGDVSYITVEHLKLSTMNDTNRECFQHLYDPDKFYQPSHGGINYEVIPRIKEENFKIIAEIANANGVKVGCGDNDLHHLTQSRCCCGIDTVGEKFDNYMKYNTTYFMTGDYDLDEIWTPDTPYRMPFGNKERSYARRRPFKQWVHDYIVKNQHLIYASGKIDILKDMGVKAIQKKLW